jgi:hypothetical protein
MAVISAGLAFGQGSVIHYFPTNPGAVMQVGKWTVANSGPNFLVTSPTGSTSTVAKAADITQSVTVFALPANSVIVSCVMKSGTAFTGTTTLTATLGVTGTLTACVSVAYDLKAAVSNTNLTAALPATPVVSIAGTNLLLALTSTVDNLSSISAGSVSVWLAYYILP